MPQLNLKPSQKIIANYYKALAESGQLSLLHEGAVAPHFAALLRAIAAPLGWTLQEQYPLPRKGQHPLRLDGVLVDAFNLRHGIWEAKDSDDDLEKEARAKFRLGYPADNILFQSPTRALLYQDGRLAADENIADRERLVSILRLFFEYEPPAFEQWQEAVAEFKDKVPELAQSLLALIETERRENKRFVDAFEGFVEMARQAINPNIAIAAVEEMLIQHLLTERIFRSVFDNPDFAQRNVVAREIERVIEALTSRAFSRTQFLGRLDRFYKAIEETAATIDNYGQKQSFLNTVYEQFFQGFSVKVADTHGIVYTPQAVVDFMVRSVDDILRREFGKADGLAAGGVAILDPFVGTGNFILRAMRQMPRSRLADKYRRELFCNEVMLLPYYIASMNIEHEYLDLTGGYEPFEGITLVDTFELAEARQPSLFARENTQRVQRQKATPIFVIVGNPPYNAHQLNENDNSKNRRYPVIDKRVAATYAAASRASNKNALSDPYVKAFRWASDRIGGEGVVAFISNSGFVDGIAFDGMRDHLRRDFDELYILDLGGNVRRNPRLSGTTHNVFGIQVGVCISLLIRRGAGERAGRVFYAAAGQDWRREQKYAYLDAAVDWRGVEWAELHPDKRHTWLTQGMEVSYESFLPMGSKETKADATHPAIFATFSNGVKTNRDTWAYNFRRSVLTAGLQRMVEFFNEHIYRRQRITGKLAVDDFVSYDESKVSWSEGLKKRLLRGEFVEVDESNLRRALYRPFATQYLAFDPLFCERTYKFPYFFPTVESEEENRAICVSDIGHRTTFSAFMVGQVADIHLLAPVDAFQYFPFYTYDEDGTGRRENVTDWALAQFRAAYDDDAISKWDIFHYIYALLHQPAYRATYAANLRRELPRIPFARDFHAYAAAGARLAELHVAYERRPEYPLTRIENRDAPLDWRVAKMRLSKDRAQIIYNDFLTLGGIPPAVFDYRLGNRSALDWVIDQYRVTTNPRSGIVNDPNRADDPQYIVRLIGQVVSVSLETQAIVAALPAEMREEG